jgi:hypothetical protein
VTKQGIVIGDSLDDEVQEKITREELQVYFSRTPEKNSQAGQKSDAYEYGTQKEQECLHSGKIGDIFSFS